MFRDCRQHGRTAIGLVVLFDESVIFEQANGCFLICCKIGTPLYRHNKLGNLGNKKTWRCFMQRQARKIYPRHSLASYLDGAAGIAANGATIGVHNHATTVRPRNGFHARISSGRRRASPVVGEDTIRGVVDTHR